jgi:hypothetical protein
MDKAPDTVLSPTEIEPLDDVVVASERIIDGETTRLVKKEVVLLYLQSYGRFDLSFAEIPNEFTNPVPLYGESGQLIGSASIYFSDDSIFADLFFDYSSPDRLTIETQAYPLYAVMVATVFIGASTGHLDGYSLMARESDVYSIFPQSIRLTTSKPPDERIKPIE